MEGFVIATVDDDGEPLQFWTGTELVEKIEQAFFYTSKEETRYRKGQVQAANNAYEVVALPAVKETRLATK